MPVKQNLRYRAEDLRLRASYVGKALRLIWSAASKWTVVWFLLLAVQGLLPAAVVYLTKWLVDSVAAVVGAGATVEGLRIVLLPAALMAGVMILQRVLGGVNQWVSTAQSELVGDRVKALIHAKAVAVDYGFYESADYHDQLEQVNSQANGRVLQLLQNIGGLLQATVTLVSISAILLQYSVFIPLILVASTIPAFLVVVRHNKRYHTWWEASTPRRRLAQYFDLMVTMDASAAEVRINNTGEYFRTRYSALRKLLREERLRLLRNQVLAQIFATFLGLLATGVALAWILLRAARGLATLGDLALFYQAFNQGQSLVGALLQNLGQIYTNTLFIEHLFTFLDQQNTLEEPEAPASFPAEIREGFRFEDVTFTYPGSERPALKNFSLAIPAGQMVAIVGENGAGKSTFIKLLCRFYDPDSGRITIDGTDIRSFSQADLRRHVSVMFQVPMKYQMKAIDNIRLGDLARDAGLDEAREAAEGGGAHRVIEKLPSGYDSILGRWFATGNELSGGEWQRVALARAFFRRAPLVVLDEPTSSMDSWAESEWLDRFRRMVEGRTALFITHRFTTAMQADIIHVMEGGRVVESGTHAELLALGGRYATSWRTQMRQERSVATGDGVADASPAGLPAPAPSDPVHRDDPLELNDGGR
jgi:ATP-binding cassette subfamily B protein